MSFVIFDLIFFGVFCLIIGLFLYRKREKLKIESKVFLLYRTKVGLKFIKWFSKKFSPLLHILSYFSIVFGFVAMILSIALLYRSIEIIISLVTIPKIPPLMPLVPYLPQIFDLPLPPFYFTYWLIIIAIVAIVHEFSHGIFASLYKLKIKATGFGFLGPFLAAFVEPDEKAMQKKSAKQQLAILSAGSFANFIFAILFLIILNIFFVLSTMPSGIIYATSSINASNITNFTIDSTIIEGLERDQLLPLLNDSHELIPIGTDNGTYYISHSLLKEQMRSWKNNSQSLIVFYNSPMIRANIQGEITKVNGIAVKDYDKIFVNLSELSPGDKVKIETTKGSYEVAADRHPLNESRGFIGLGSTVLPISGFAKVLQDISSVPKNPFMFYSPKYDMETFTFSYDLLWWLVLICISIALINMLPLGMLDGGRFIYVTALGLTKSKKFAEITFKIAAFLVVLILLALTIVWFVKII
ncbi:MAG: site-2 protease family protein [Candidatus Pacearchaeota archaeon]